MAHLDPGAVPRARSGRLVLRAGSDNQSVTMEAIKDPIIDTEYIKTQVATAIHLGGGRVKVFISVPSEGAVEVREDSEKRLPDFSAYVDPQKADADVVKDTGQATRPLTSLVYTAVKDGVMGDGDMFGEWTFRTVVLVFAGFILKTLFNRYLLRVLDAI